MAARSDSATTTARIRASAGSLSPFLPVPPRAAKPSRSRQLRRSQELHPFLRHERGSLNLGAELEDCHSPALSSGSTDSYTVMTRSETRTHQPPRRPRAPVLFASRDVATSRSTAMMGVSGPCLDRRCLIRTSLCWPLDAVYAFEGGGLEVRGVGVAEQVAPAPTLAGASSAPSPRAGFSEPRYRPRGLATPIARVRRPAPGHLPSVVTCHEWKLLFHLALSPASHGPGVERAPFSSCGFGSMIASTPWGFAHCRSPPTCAHCGLGSRRWSDRLGRWAPAPRSHLKACSHRPARSENAGTAQGAEM